MARGPRRTAKVTWASDWVPLHIQKIVDTSAHTATMVAKRSKRFFARGLGTGLSVIELRLQAVFGVVRRAGEASRNCIDAGTPHLVTCALFSSTIPMYIMTFYREKINIFTSIYRVWRGTVLRKHILFR